MTTTDRSTISYALYVMFNLTKHHSRNHFRNEIYEKKETWYCEKLDTTRCLSKQDRTRQSREKGGGTISFPPHHRNRNRNRNRNTVIHTCIRNDNTLSRAQYIVWLEIPFTCSTFRNFFAYNWRWNEMRWDEKCIQVMSFGWGWIGKCC